MTPTDFPEGLRIGSSLRLDGGTGVAASGRRMRLLESLGRTGSIAAAAREVGLSYKAAWDAVEAMNNLSDQPLVARVKGGKGGGGTTLTARGRQIVERFVAIEAEIRRFCDRLNAQGSFAPGDAGPRPLERPLEPDWRLIGRLGMHTSARNQFFGRITRVVRGAVNDEVALTLPGGETLVAIVTHESTENLGLVVGREAMALLKASWIILLREDDRPLRLSARNRLQGIVQRVTPGAVNTEVVLQLRGGNSLAAIVTNAAARDLELVTELPVTAIFKASSVILAVTG